MSWMSSCSDPLCHRIHRKGANVLHATLIGDDAWAGLSVDAGLRGVAAFQSLPLSSGAVRFTSAFMMAFSE